MQRFLISLTVLYCLCLTGVSDARTRHLHILYTGGVGGELETCGCSPKTDFGGVVRRGGFIESQGMTLSPSVIVEAGNFLGEDTKQGRLKAEAMVEALAIMGYDVVALGWSERLYPDGFISELLQRWELPLLSGIDEFRRSIILERGDLSVNLSVDLEGQVEGAINILLADVLFAELQSVKGWDIVILSSGELLETPRWKDGAVVVSGYPRGERLGVVKLTVDDRGEPIGVDHRWQLLGVDEEESPAVRAILDSYNEKVATLLKESYEPAKESTFTGIARCAECHQTYVDDWKKSGHSRAWSVLEGVGKTGDPECIKCHVVGFGEEGGFHSFDTTPELANVQCEVCHGQGAGHVTDFYKPMREVGEATCLRCHTEQNSPDFDYPVYRGKINHKQMWED